MVYESFLGKKPHNRYFIFNKCVTDPIQLSVSHHLVTRRRYGDHSHSKASVFNGLKALLDRSLNKVDRLDSRYDLMILAKKRLNGNSCHHLCF